MNPVRKSQGSFFIYRPRFFDKGRFFNMVINLIF